MCGLWVLGDEEEEEEEEGRSLSKLGQPGREPPPGGRTGTRYRRLNKGEDAPLRLPHSAATASLSHEQNGLAYRLSWLIID
jgi:hypothetical protein